MGDTTSKQVDKLRRPENSPRAITSQSPFYKAGSLPAESQVKLLSYRHNNNQTKDNAFLHDCIDVTCDNEMHQENYETNVYRRKDSCHSVTSLKCAEAVIYGVDSKPLLEMHNLDPTGRQVSSPESSPRSSGSEVSCSFCDDSIQLFRDNQESEGFHVSGCTRKRTYVRFPFAYPTLEELISSRAVIDYETFESELSIENVPAESGLNELDDLRQGTIARSDCSEAPVCDDEIYATRVDEVYRAENTNFLLVEGVLNVDEDPLNEWSWPDTFDQTTLTHDTTYDETVPVYENLVDDGSLLEKKQSLNLADETFRKFCKPDKGGGFHAAGCTARRVIRTIIIDSDGDLNVSKEILSYPPEVVTSSPAMTKSRQTSDADTMVDLASDLYDVLKELSPSPIRKSWNILESAAKKYVKGLLQAGSPLVEDFSFLHWTHQGVFPVA